MMEKEIANSKLGWKIHHFCAQSSHIFGSKICHKSKTTTMCETRNQKSEFKNRGTKKLRVKWVEGLNLRDFKNRRAKIVDLLK